MRLKKLFDPRVRRKISAELLKYSIVGVLGVFLNLSLLFVLTEFAHFYYICSAVFAWFVASALNFCLDKVWAFKKKSEDGFFREYPRYILIMIISLVLNLGVLYFLTEVCGIYYMYSQSIGIFLLRSLTFSYNKLWTFRD